MTKSDWPLVGHQWAVRLLQSALQPDPAGDRQRSRLRHAYLFTGPRHTGKTALSLAFAKTLLCQERVDAPCNACRSCRLFDHGNHPDFRLIQPLSKAPEKEESVVDRENGRLYVAQATEIVHEAMLRPVEGRRKIFVVQDIQSGGDIFANKLLKTLEEPPEPVILLLTAADRSVVLPTVVSRCQVLDLRPVDAATTATALIETFGMEEAQARLTARLAGGRPGWALQQAQDPKGFEQRESDLRELQNLIQANRVERLAFADGLSSVRDNQRLFALLALWQSWWRDVMLAQAGSADSCANLDQLHEIRRQAQAISPAGVHAYLKTLKRIEGYLHHTINTKLALDVLLLELPHEGRNP